MLCYQFHCIFVHQLIQCLQKVGLSLVGWHSCLWQLVTWLDWVWTGRGVCSPLSVLWQLLDSNPELPTSPKTEVTLPLQVDLQQFGHLWQYLQNSSDLHRKHLSHILFLCDCNNKWDLRLSFVATRWQNEHLQHKRLHEKIQSRSCWTKPCVSPSLVKGSNSSDRVHKQGLSARLHFKHSNCHLRCLEPLAGFCEKEVGLPRLFFPWWRSCICFQTGKDDVRSGCCETLLLEA